MTERALAGVYFCGNRASEFAIEAGRLDYATLSQEFDMVLCNDIIWKTVEYFGEWELINGQDYDPERDDYVEGYQFFIISPGSFEVLKDWTDEIVYYNEELDLYVWMVTHWGTPWTGVLTDIRLNGGEREANAND